MVALKPHNWVHGPVAMVVNRIKDAITAVCDVRIAPCSVVMFKEVRAEGGWGERWRGGFRRVTSYSLQGLG